METIKRDEIAEGDFVIRPIAPQRGFLLSEARYPAYVGAWGTGKSMTGIGKAMAFSENYDNNLGIIFRKEFTDLKDSTIKDFENYTGLKIDSSREVHFPNGSVIMFRHLEELNNLQNVNLGWFWIEQAEEIETDEPFFVLFGRLRRAGMPQQGFITANTAGHNWIYKLWKLKGLEDAELFEAKTEDNKENLPESFIKSLSILKDKKPRIYNRFVMNSWEDADTVDIIIRPELVNKAIARILSSRPPLRRIISIDVARYGDDRTVFYALETGQEGNVKTLGAEVHEKKSTMETVGLAMRFARKFDDIESFAVDEIGVGGGVVDRLMELGKDVIPVNSAKKSSTPDQFYNTRAEIYSTGADKFDDGRVSLREEDKDLIEELVWAKYKTIKSNGLLQIESKDDIKERYGRSPDHADAFLGGLWALPQAKIVKRMDKYQRRFEDARSRVEFNPMTV